MTCRNPLSGDAIVEVARGRDVGRGTIAAVEAHTEHCAACAARLARERQVSEGLRALADATATAAPSESLEAQLLAAFPVKASGPRPAWLVPAAAAAMVAAIVWWRATPALLPPPSLPPAPPVEVGLPAALLLPIDAGFVALPAAASMPPFESGVIVRMELPQSALPAYGLEVVQGSKAPVEADLLIAQDGQARAIRLVNRSVTRAGAEQ